MSHLVRVGLIGHVGRFRAVDRVVYARGARVVVRTSRGLEVGEVLASPAESGGAESAEQPDGELLRRMTPADDLLEARLERHKCDALDACERRIAELQLDATLLDAELLFDGSSLFFYFLGEPDPQLEAVTAELAAAYDAEARLSQFVDLLEHGCGPDCGTESASGCGDGGCSSCAVAAACKPAHQTNGPSESSDS
ncbi:MAG: hypothetical protein KDB14_27555 [Planctomycetales bacterium]|nr:hypothetical protein [Planctomycetales bacterium]